MKYFFHAVGVILLITFIWFAFEPESLGSNARKVLIGFDAKYEYLGDKVE